MIYIFICFLLDTKRERKGNKDKGNTTIIQSVLIGVDVSVDFMIVITMFVIIS